MMPNWAWSSSISLRFSPEPAEEIADTEMPAVGSSLTLISVESATPTG